MRDHPLGAGDSGRRPRARPADQSPRADRVRRKRPAGHVAARPEGRGRRLYWLVRRSLLYARHRRNRVLHLRASTSTGPERRARAPRRPLSVEGSTLAWRPDAVRHAGQRKIPRRTALGSRLARIPPWVLKMLAPHDEPRTLQSPDIRRGPCLKRLWKSRAASSKLSTGPIGTDTRRC